MLSDTPTNSKWFYHCGQATGKNLVFLTVYDPHIVLCRCICLCQQFTYGYFSIPALLAPPRLITMNRLILSCVFCLGLAAASTGHDTEPHELEHGPLVDAKGIVYNDVNGNRKLDDGEAGIPGIRVSNGRQIVKTNDQGAYSLLIDNDDIIFVIKPRDWVTPLNKNKSPQFFYIHKPDGSPKGRFEGVAPTGPLPESVNFPLRKRPEPNKFKAIMFGDPQPRNVKEVQYMQHDVIEQIIANNAHDAAFGVTLGDIVFDDLDVMEPHNQAVALIGIPWYNVIGNHDLNLDVKHDHLSDETFERHYGPAYYSFDHGPTHFLVLDDVMWHWNDEQNRGHYHGGLGKQQMEFIKNDLAGIPENQLVVLLMHIPLNGVKDRQELYRLIEKRPATVSLSAHTHYMEHRFIGKEDGWRGKQKHHHIVNVTVCGSWWRGQKDERGIPHATMSDGGPNGYSIMEFDGDQYSLDIRGAGRPAKYQMNIYAPEVVETKDLATTVIHANVFNGSEKSKVAMRVDDQGDWIDMERLTRIDPAFKAEKDREAIVNTAETWVNLPGAHNTPHFWRAMLPAKIATGTHKIEVKVLQSGGKTYKDHRIFQVKAND